MQSNPQLELAQRYIEQTGVSVFLTGKAGTGKTTFLREIAARCPKRHTIVAPTGVAAINAGGVTIHSFFQLPFDPYLPDVKELVTEYQMPDKYKSLNKTKLNIIRTLELLIIDEISMVRADLLDAIDMTLRRCRRSSRPFGGVQLLMIGDVHQLAPVVTEHERPFMERVYPTPYFFASKALQQLPYVTIELTTVYRQQDAAFVDLLNHVRDNNLDDATLHVLNSRVDSQATKQSNNQAIVLTTHNRQADAINQRHMQALHGERRLFEATLTGDYPDKSLPCERSLEIKVGERVMFVKNDSSGAYRYYNGMLGTVTGFLHDDDKDYIEVIDDNGETINTGLEVWESMRYTLNPDTNEIEQEVEGRFVQYPLQAAWAVTIHKAQGLTFDRVSIDAADAFAFGQVYVALSRCRTLEGLTLTTPLSPNVAFSDRAVSRFVNEQPTFEQAVASVPSYEQQYRIEKLMELFSIDDLLRQTERLNGTYAKLRPIYPDQCDAMVAIVDSLAKLQSVSERFKNQLMRLDFAAQDSRALQGASYFLSQLVPMATQLPSLVGVTIDNKENASTVADDGAQLSEALGLKLACLSAVEKEGYSVQVVQRAKTKHLLDSQKGEPKTHKGRSRAASTRKKTSASSKDSSMPTLAELLRHWRAVRADEQGVPPYIVLQQKALQAIVVNRPTTLDALRDLPGIGDRTVERYGTELIALVKEAQSFE